jgi:predicted phosphodiesterase
MSKPLLKDYHSQIRDYLEAYTGHTEPTVAAVSKMLAAAKDEQGRLLFPFSWLSLQVSDVVKRYVQALKEADTISVADKLQEMEAEGEEKEPYTIEGDSYCIKSAKGKLTFSIALIDRLFFEFSEKGLNRTGAQIRLDHNLKPWEWGAIKNRLSLYKHSHIFSPYTWDNTPLEKRQQMVSEKMEGLLQNTGQVVRQEYDKYIIKEYRKVVEKKRRLLIAEEEALGVLAEYFCEPRTVTVPRAFNVKNAIEHLVVKFGDPHMGAEVDESNAVVLTLKYSPAILYKYLERMAALVNSYNAKKVTLLVAGDLIESSTGLNHANVWQSLSRGYYGAKATISSFEMLVYLAENIVNLENIIGVGGNHDRGTAKKDEDTLGSVAATVFWFLRRILKGAVNVEYHPLIVALVIDNINYILSHGHLLLTRKVSEVVKDYGRANMYNLFVTAHKHTVDLPTDKLDYRHLQLGPLFTGNNYSEGLGFTSLPSFMVSYNLNNSGYAQTNIVPLLDWQLKQELTAGKDYLSSLSA